MGRIPLAAALTGALALAGVASCAPAPTHKAANWVACPASLSTELKCLTVTVPLDWDNPKGETIDIVAAKYITNGTNKIGSAVFQWGGPGNPTAISLVQDMNGTVPAFGEIKDQFDIVAVDPRGVGINHVIKCDPSIARKQDLITALYPNNEQEFNAGIKLYKELGQSCTNRTGKVINHLDTVTQAKDLEAVRVAMGEGKLTYYGLSWGTMRGQAYAQLYPQNIRAMILDGVVDHTLSFYDFTTAGATGFANSQHRFLDWASNNETSPLNGQDARAIMKSVLAQADAKPIPISSCQKGLGAPCRSELTGNDIRGMVLNWLDHPNFGYAMYAQALSDASQGNWTYFGGNNLINEYEYAVTYSMLGIICQDYDFHQSWEEFQQTQMVTAALSMDMEGADASRLWSIACKGWPTPLRNPPKDYRITNTSAPILLVHALWDDATPYQWAVAVNRKIAGSVLLTRDGEGHGSLGFNKTRALMYAYLADPVKNLPKPLTVTNESWAYHETDGFNTRGLAVNME